MGDILGDAVVEAHLAAFEEREAGAHVVEHAGRLEGVFHFGRAVVLLGELQQLLARLAKGGQDIGLHLLADRHMQSAAYTHNGVQRGADGAAQRAAALDDVGLAQAVATPEELQARGLILHQIGGRRLEVGAVHPQLVEHVVGGAVAARAAE